MYLSEETKTFENFIITEVGYCKRKPENKRKSESLEGISNFHSIWINKHGHIKGSILTCTKCTISQRCEDCDSPVTQKEKNNTNQKKQYDSKAMFQEIGCLGGNDMYCLNYWY